MERKPDSQQVEVITIQPKAAQLSNTRFRMAVLLFFMTLWPWFWVSFGLYVIKDFRVTIALYEIFGCALPILLLRGGKAPIWPLNVPSRFLFLAVLVANIMFLGIFKQTGGILLDWKVFAEHAKGIHLGDNLEFWGYGVFLVFFNPIFEEVYWRGTIYREWRALIGPTKANLLSSFFFGLWHWLVVQHFCEPLMAISSTFTVMIGGVIFAYAYQKTGTLGASILMHGLGADLPLLFIVHTAILHSATLTAG